MTALHMPLDGTMHNLNKINIFYMKHDWSVRDNLNPYMYRENKYPSTKMYEYS